MNFFIVIQTPGLLNRRKRFTSWCNLIAGLKFLRRNYSDDTVLLCVEVSSTGQVDFTSESEALSVDRLIEESEPSESA